MFSYEIEVEADQDPELLIYMRYHKYDVVVPREHAFQFMEAFGRALAVQDVMDGGRSIRCVDRYYEFPASFHVVVSVHESEVKTFNAFLRDFSKQHKIRLRDPEGKKHR